MRRRFAVVAALAIAIVPLTPARTLAAPGQAACPRTPATAQQISDTPWAQKLWDYGKLPAGADGSGVIVAVIDSGIDANHAQLAGKVIDGIDKLRSGDGRQDCVGHGTGVAALIAGSQVGKEGMRGLAPGVKLLSARVSEKIPGQEQNSPEASVADVAFAIDWAVSRHAGVINLSLSYTNANPSDLEPVRQAIARAVAADVVVVAAVGNGKNNGNPTPYPAAWPDVLGVGAVGAGGQRLDASQTGSYVDISAPGEGMTTAWPGGGQVNTQSGTSFATPLVSAAAALVRQRFPHLTEAEVRHRLTATADPAPGGRQSVGYGAGILNPLRALTDVLDDVKPVDAQALPVSAVDPAQAAAQERVTAQRERAWWVAAIGAVVVLIALALMLALPAGLRRRWRPAGQAE